MNERCQQCEGDIAKQCTSKKRVKDEEWFKEKMLLAQAQEADVVLQEDQQDFLADSEIFLASISHARLINGDIVGPTYDLDIISEVPHYDNYLENDVLNYDVQEMEYIEYIVSKNDT
ncbi:hypothetical protein Tco_1188966, partial [Tanacetum coccineum]